MQAGVIEAQGEAPRYTDFPEPEAGEGRHVVEMVGAGIHRVVRARAAGTHYSQTGQWPMVPGVDAVAREADGRLVYTGFVTPPWGTLAERLSVADGFRAPLPEGIDPLAVAAGMNPGLAGWIPLARRSEALGGDLGTVVVLGATGISGTMAVESAFALGASRVIGVGRNPEALARLGERGAVPVPIGEHLTSELVAAMGAVPPTSVVDFLWGGAAESAFRAMGDDSVDRPDYDVHFVQVGTMAGDTARVPGALLRSRRFTLSGSGFGSTPPSEILSRAGDLMTAMAAGLVSVPYTVYPLSRVGEAWTSTDATRPVVVPD